MLKGLIWTGSKLMSYDSFKLHHLIKVDGGAVLVVVALRSNVQLRKIAVVIGLRIQSVCNLKSLNAILLVKAGYV